MPMAGLLHVGLPEIALSNLSKWAGPQGRRAAGPQASLVTAWDTYTIVNIKKLIDIVITYI